MITCSKTQLTRRLIVLAIKNALFLICVCTASVCSHWIWFYLQVALGSAWQCWMNSWGRLSKEAQQGPAVGARGQWRGPWHSLGGVSQPLLPCEPSAGEQAPTPAPRTPRSSLGVSKPLTATAAPARSLCSLWWCCPEPLCSLQLAATSTPELPALGTFCIMNTNNSVNISALHLKQLCAHIHIYSGNEILSIPSVIKEDANLRK